MELYGRVRRAVLVERKSHGSVVREFGLARVTVRKMLGYSIPPGYRRKQPAKRPKLGAVDRRDRRRFGRRQEQTSQAAAHRAADDNCVFKFTHGAS